MYITLVNDVLLQYGHISGLLLPGKRTFHNLDKKFLEKRRIALDAYLQVRCDVMFFISSKLYLML